MENRVPEASALREFFHEQWEHLLQLIHESHKFGDDGHGQRQQIVNAVEHIVEQVDARIRGVSSYQERLRNSASELIHYVKEIVTGLPAATTIDKNSYTSESFINAIFACNGEVEQLVRESDEIGQFAREHMQTSDFGLYTPDFYALLFVVREEQKIFGGEIKEDVLTKDVAQTAVNFYGHQLVAPALSEQDARSSLEKILFDSAISALRSNMVKLRHGQSHDEQIDAALHPEQNINNPEVYLKLLSEQLSMPKNIIGVQHNMLRISKMGIKLADDTGGLSNELNFNEVAIGNLHSKVVLLVRIKYSDWN